MAGLIEMKANTFYIPERSHWRKMRQNTNSNTNTKSNRIEKYLEAKTFQSTHDKVVLVEMKLNNIHQ